MIFVKQDNARQLIKSDNKQKAEFHSLESCLDLADEAFDMEDYPTAIRFLCIAVEMSPEDPRPIREMAKIDIINKQWNEAMKCIDYLLLLNPNDDDDAVSARELLEARINYYSMVKQFPLYS